MVELIRDNLQDKSARQVYTGRMAELLARLLAGQHAAGWGFLVLLLSYKLAYLCGPAQTITLAE